MLDLSGLPKIPMWVISFVVFIMTSWAVLPDTWLGQSYVMSNYFIVLLGVWAERDNPAPVPVQALFFGFIFTLLNDILTIAIMYPSNVNSSTIRFNAAMAIIMIIGKPVATLFVYREWQERVGGGHAGGQNYEHLGGQQPNQGNQGGYGVYDVKNDAAPQYQPPNNRPFP